MTIELTEAARQKIKEIIEADWHDKLVYLKMAVKGGGCSGLSYALELRDAEKDPIDEKHDKEFEIGGIRVVIDKKSYLYLAGTTLDYVTQGLAGGFTFVNPNAKSSCGCGTSFSV